MLANDYLDRSVTFVFYEHDCLIFCPSNDIKCASISTALVHLISRSLFGSRSNTAVGLGIRDAFSYYLARIT